MGNISKSIEKWFHAYTFKIQDQFDEGWVEGLVVIPEEPNFFSEPYSSVWIKILGTILYLVQVRTNLCNFECRAKYCFFLKKTYCLT